MLAASVGQVLLLRAVLLRNDIADLMKVETAQLVRWALPLEHLLKLQFLNQRVFLLERLLQL